jgi:hypothetical protein
MNLKTGTMSSYCKAVSNCNLPNEAVYAYTYVDTHGKNLTAINKYTIRYRLWMSHGLSGCTTPRGTHRKSN